MSAVVIYRRARRVLAWSLKHRINVAGAHRRYLAALDGLRVEGGKA